MFLKQLTLTNYKNIEASKFDFKAPINCFIGNNGIGKSNILDSIYHLAFTKSYFNPSSLQNIKFDKEFFVIEGRFERKSKEEKINCSLKRGQKKTIKRNGKVYDKIADHIGLIPLVIISQIGQPEEAYEYYVAAFQASDNLFSAPKYLYKAGMLGANLGKNKAALNYFKRIKSDYPDAAEADLVDVQIGRLENL